MRFRRAIVITGVFASLLMMLIRMGLSTRREPVYQAKPLSSWLQQYGTNHWSSRHKDLDTQAENAIRQIGTNATPFLLKMMAATESPVRVKILTNLPKSWQTRLHLSDAKAYRHQLAEQRRLGAWGFVALGLDAKPAVPDLIALLHAKDSDVRYVSVFAVRCLGPVARDALPSVITCLDDPEFTVRDDAVMAIGTIQEDPDRVVPLLIRFLEKHRSDRILCDDGIASLGAFGPQAKPAIPILLEFLHSEHASVRSAATNALRRIDLDFDKAPNQE